MRTVLGWSASVYPAPFFPTLAGRGRQRRPARVAQCDTLADDAGTTRKTNGCLSRRHARPLTRRATSAGPRHQGIGLADRFPPSVHRSPGATPWLDHAPRQRHMDRAKDRSARPASRQGHCESAIAAQKVVRSALRNRSESSWKSGTALLHAVMMQLSFQLPMSEYHCLE
jgi:hypothetical protein